LPVFEGRHWRRMDHASATGFVLRHSATASVCMVSVRDVRKSGIMAHFASDFAGNPKPFRLAAEETWTLKSLLKPT